MESDNQSHVESLLSEILAGRGRIFLADSEGEVAGLLIAMLNPNVWDSQILCLNELAWWVEPKYRQSSAGYKLLLAYRTYAQEQKSQDKIKYFTISKMVNSPNLDYSRFEFDKLEEMWSQ
jgi:hypothetical protein